MSKTLKNILITRTDRIGDVILSLPVAGAIKDALPNSQVTFMVRAPMAPIAQMCPWVDDVLMAREGRDIAGQRNEIAQRRFDAAICLYPRSEIATLLRAAGVPIRVGTARRFFSLKFNRRINISRSAGGRHERDFNLDLLRGIEIKEPTVHDPRCIPPQEVKDKARIMLGELGIDPNQHRFVVVHPGCGGSARNWASARYAELCRSLKSEGLAILVSGSSEEKELTRQVATDSGDGAADLAGRADLPMLAAILEMATVFIGPSTGPMHLAAAVGTPVVTLFGPVRTTGPDRWGPLGNQHRVFETGAPVCRCPVDRCKLGDCMDRISVTDVADAVMEIARH